MNPEVLAELDFVFSQLPPSYKNKIPKDLIDSANQNKDMDRYNELDTSKPFTKQKLSEKTLEILNNLFKQYFVM